MNTARAENFEEAAPDKRRTSRLDSIKSKRSPKLQFRREISAGAVVFRETGGEKEYLVLHYTPPERLGAGPTQEKAKKQKFKESWGFPKGQVEKGEDLEEAARREVREETGLDALEFIPGFREKIHYFFIFENTLISKDAVYFLAKAPEASEVKISPEHSGYEWLGHECAMARLTHKNDRAVLKKAVVYLNGFS